MVKANSTRKWIPECFKIYPKTQQIISVKIKSIEIKTEKVTESQKGALNC